MRPFCPLNTRKARKGTGAWPLAAALIVVVGSPASAGELKAGVGRADLTPPVGTPLGGYGDRRGRPSTGVHDPIHAKALVLDDGTTRLAIVATDLVGSSPHMTRRVAEACGIPREQLMICASHTHSGPGAYGRGIFPEVVLGKYDPKVEDRLVEGMTSAVRKAVASLQPAGLAVGESELPGFMRNRRKVRLKDPALWVMRVDSRDGKPLAALVDLTAHGTVLDEKNMHLSGDWMAATQAYLEREVPGLTALYANGAEGDISPNIPDNSSTIEGARAHGEKGGAAALALYRSLKPEPEVKLAFKTAMLDLPQSLKAAFIGAGKQTMLQCFIVNDAVLIAVPGEMIAQLGLALKDHARRQGLRLPTIVGLANDHLGYLLTRAEMKRGGYESTVSFFGDAFGEELTVAIGRLLGGDPEPLKSAIAAEPERQ